MMEFWLGIAQTAIGSGIGFGFGILAFHYQQKRQSERLEEADWRASLDALTRLNTAAGANIEALANSKLQLIDDLRADVQKMKKITHDIFDIPPEDLSERMSDLKKLSGSLRHFYKSLNQTSILPPPDAREYSKLSKEMPALSLFAHRAISMMQELNARITSRNALIAEHAREGGTEEGMSDERLTYFSSMLADEGEAMYVMLDYALSFWKLVLDQVAAYMTHKARGEHFAEYQLVAKAIEALPSEELFPAMREKLVTFENVRNA